MLWIPASDPSSEPVAGEGDRETNCKNDGPQTRSDGTEYDVTTWPADTPALYFCLPRCLRYITSAPEDAGIWG